MSREACHALTLVVTLEPELREKIETYRTRLEHGHASRGTPRAVTTQEALLEAAKLGVATAEGLTALLGMAEKSRLKNKEK